MRRREVAALAAVVKAPRLNGSKDIARVVRQWGRPLYTVSSNHRALVTTFIYSALAVASYVGAHLLRFDFNVPAQYRDEIVVTLPLVVLFRLAASYAFSISTGRWRYVGIYDVLRLTASTATGSAALFALTWGNDAFAPVPRSVLVTDFVLFTVFIAATWVLYRTAFEQIRLMEGDRSKQTRVLIVGAGDGGTMLAREILRSGHQRRVVGFVDDDPAKWNTTVHGLRVFGKPDMVPQLVARLNVQEIVVAIPSAAPAQLRRLVELCQATDVAFKVLPGMSEVLEGKVHWSQVRPLQIEDLLGREPVALELPDLLGDLCGRSVLVTGAAGSIGSELVRQIALHREGRDVLARAAWSSSINGKPACSISATICAMPIPS